VKLKELKELSVDELNKIEADLRKDLMNVRFEHAVGKLLDTAAPSKKRKELARVLTLLQEKNKQHINLRP
jgi:large subunit ribosomal protein L29